jgi:5-methylthioribose kinase
MDFILNAENLEELQFFLRKKKWIAPDEVLKSATKPGEGNMNYVLRIRSNFRSFILKQSREYVEKYPQIAAPATRANVEGGFYQLIQEYAQLRELTPELSEIDLDNHLLLLEDLGESHDFSFLYQVGKDLESKDLAQIIQFISLLHHEFNRSRGTATISNREMRALNAEHLFEYPFLEENGFDLDQVLPGLQAVARPYKQDATLQTQIDALREAYLADGEYLLHGDYFPGSWLKTLDGIRVIDPEFCFFGPAEFDLGVLTAHLMMAEQSPDLLQQVWDLYEAPPAFSMRLAQQFAGIEIMRRIIGLAQLPLGIDLPTRSGLLQQARELIMGK